jgi:hypothetical protein
MDIKWILYIEIQAGNEDGLYNSDFNIAFELAFIGFMS